jgi:multiple sugar transport system permease protein
VGNGVTRADFAFTDWNPLEDYRACLPNAPLVATQRVTSGRAAVLHHRGSLARASLGQVVRRHALDYLFLTPMLVLFVAFTIWPMLATWIYSLYAWDGFEPLHAFVGLSNFVEAARDPGYWLAFAHTFTFSIAAIAIQVPLALIIALILNDRLIFARDVYRILIFLPVITTTAVIGVVFDVLLDPSGGPVNALLQNAHIAQQPIEFLSSATLALPTVVVIKLWKDLGITMIYWLAALQTIPSDVYEAARMDGANAWRMLLHITLPLLKPFAVIIMLLTFVSSFAAFDIVQVMTQGGPAHASEIVETYIFRYAFNPESSTPRYGFASASAVLFGVAVLLLTVVQAAVARRAGSLRGTH